MTLEPNRLRTSLKSLTGFEPGLKMISSSSSSFLSQEERLHEMDQCVEHADTGVWALTAMICGFRPGRMDCEEQSRDGSQPDLWDWTYTPPSWANLPDTAQRQTASPSLKSPSLLLEFAVFKVVAGGNAMRGWLNGAEEVCCSEHSSLLSLLPSSLSVESKELKEASIFASFLNQQGGGSTWASVYCKELPCRDAFQLFYLLSD